MTASRSVRIALQGTGLQNAARSRQMGHSASCAACSRHSEWPQVPSTGSRICPKHTGQIRLSVKQSMVALSVAARATDFAGLGPAWGVPIAVVGPEVICEPCLGAKLG